MSFIKWALAVLGATGCVLLLWTFNSSIDLPTTNDQHDELIAHQQSAPPPAERPLYNGSQLVMVAATTSGLIERYQSTLH
jgi:hypothetical protein